ncbi:hypothetical protein AB7V73_21715, partial [Escherichia coli]
ADRNRSHWSTSKTPSYTKSVSWQHHPRSLARSKGHRISPGVPRICLCCITIFSVSNNLQLLADAA